MTATMTVKQFQAQCLSMLLATREWPEETWEELEDTWTMSVMDAMCDLEHYIEQENQHD